MNGSQKLNESIVPSLYDLEFIPRIPEGFHGILNIEFSVRSPSPCAELHAAETLTIISVTQDRKPVRHERDSVVLKLFSDDFSQPLRIEFDGKLGDIYGFYETSPKSAAT
jgi:hypothetical protein